MNHHRETIKSCQSINQITKPKEMAPNEADSQSHNGPSQWHASGTNALVSLFQWVGILILFRYI